MITYPNAKINLGLNIIARRPDGYHDLETIFYPIPLQDALEINTQKSLSSTVPTEKKINETLNLDLPSTDYTLQIEGTAIECPPEKNLVIKAYRLLQKEFCLPPLHIRMNKQIPSGAGLGGGSSDAAFMMKMLNEEFHLGLSETAMEARIATLGADCAFFIRNMPVFATGIGNIFTPMSCSLQGWYLVLVKPDIFISTQEAYSKIRPHRPTCPLTDIIQHPVETWRHEMINDFEEGIFSEHPEIAAIKNELYNRGAIYASMSGSGSSVFGLFKEQLNHAEDIFGTHFCRQFLLP